MPVPVHRKGLHFILPIVRIPFASGFGKTISTFRSGGFANLPALTGSILFPKTLPTSFTSHDWLLIKGQWWALSTKAFNTMQLFTF
jgi:hypothetical protein